MKARGRGMLGAMALIATLVADGPAQGELFRPQTAVLANGLEVVVIENHRAPVVAHMVYYRVGSGDEAPGKTGLAHYLEHLMFKGSERFGPGFFSREIQRQGGRDNAFTTYDYTAYFQTLAVDRLGVAMEMEADRMRGLKLNDAVALPERDVVLEERRQRIDGRPGATLTEEAMAALFAPHPYGVAVIGKESDMAGLTWSDAVAFHERWYAPNNAVVVLSGALSLAEALPLVERHYGGVAARPLPERRRPPAPSPLDGEPTRIVQAHPQAREPSWSRRWIAPSWRTDPAAAIALQVAAEALGGPGGRLHQRLVDPGPGVAAAAVSASAGYDPDRWDKGLLGVYAQPVQGVSPERLEAAVDAVLADILAEGLTDEEVGRAARRLSASAAYALDGLGAAARIIGAARALDRPADAVERWPADVAAVTAARANAALAAVLSGRSVTALLTPAPSATR